MITREMESKLPDFANGLEAIDYFKLTYGDEFEYQFFELVEGQIVAFYNLDGQSIQIFDDGIVHITH